MESADQPTPHIHELNVANDGQLSTLGKLCLANDGTLSQVGELPY